MGRSSEARSWIREGPTERQFGNPGPTGKAAERTALRSGGKEKPNSASAKANSEGDKPGWSRILEFLRWVMSLSAREVKEKRLLLRGGREVEEVVVAAALAERRRSPAAWDGVRPVILRSTSTIVCDIKDQ